MTEITEASSLYVFVFKIKILLFKSHGLLISPAPQTTPPPGEAPFSHCDVLDLIVAGGFYLFCLKMRRT